MEAIAFQSIRACRVTLTDITERIAAQRREQFLARAAEVLASSLDYEQTVQTVADLMVPTFADWCTVQVAEPTAESAVAPGPPPDVSP